MRPKEIKTKSAPAFLQRRESTSVPSIVCGNFVVALFRELWQRSTPMPHSDRACIILSYGISTIITSWFTYIYTIICNLLGACGVFSSYCLRRFSHMYVGRYRGVIIALQHLDAIDLVFFSAIDTWWYTVVLEHGHYPILYCAVI